MPDAGPAGAGGRAFNASAPPRTSEPDLLASLAMRKSFATTAADFLPARLRLPDLRRVVEQELSDAWMDGIQSAFGATFAQTSDGGLVITRVEPNSFATRAELRAGDRLLSLDGRRIAGAADVLRYMASLQRGADVGLEVWRDGRALTLYGTFGQSGVRHLPSCSSCRDIRLGARVVP
jgi:S1-C subfamily serine protease